MTETMTSHPTPYPDLNALLGELVKSIKVVLGDNFLGAYLQGSFAIGDYDIHSDVDFIIAMEAQLTDRHVARLQRMHERIYTLEIPWAQHLEGSYFPRRVLRCYKPQGDLLWYLDHGARALILSDHCDTIVVRWTLRKYGVVLDGPPPEKLIDPIPVETLRQDILATINDWGQEILSNPERFDNRFYQGYIVLSYCRMLHDFVEGDLGSKRVGADWAKGILDPSWVGLIDRAWNGRPDPARSVHEPADAQDFQATLAFVSHIIDECNLVAAELGIEG